MVIFCKNSTSNTRSKNDHFLGALGVVYNYIHSIYYIFFDRYTIQHIFLCRNVGM